MDQMIQGEQLLQVQMERRTKFLRKLREQIPAEPRDGADGDGAGDELGGGGGGGDPPIAPREAAAAVAARPQSEIPIFSPPGRGSPGRDHAIPKEAHEL